MSISSLEKMNRHSFSPTFKPLSSWNEENVLSWMRGLDPALQPHLPQFQAHCIHGSDIVTMDRQKLEYLKMTQVGHQELMLEAIELLLALDNSIHHQTALRRVRVLSKKSSQLVQLTSNPYPHSKDYSHSLELSAAVMEASRNIITWLDSNPCKFISNYGDFRRKLVETSLEIKNSVALEPEDCRQELLEHGKSIVGLTSGMIAPQVLQQEDTTSDGVIILDVLLKPDLNGLGISIERIPSGQLIIAAVKKGSASSRSGRVFVGDEVVQINGQNVVGWVVSNVVDCIRAKPYEALLTLKSNVSRTPPIPRRHTPSKDTPSSTPGSPSLRNRQSARANSYRYSLPINPAHTSLAPNNRPFTPTAPPTDPALSYMTSKETSITSKDESITSTLTSITSTLTSVTSTDTSGASTSGLPSSSPVAHRLNGHRPLTPSKSEPIQNTESKVNQGNSPVNDELILITDHEADNELSSERDTPDGEGDNISRRAQSVPLEEIPSRPTSSVASNTPISGIKNMDKQQSSSTGDLPSTCYRTKVIGGVVHRIPISASPVSSPSPELPNNQQVYKTMVVGGVVVKMPVDRRGGKSAEPHGGRLTADKKRRKTLKKAKSADVPLNDLRILPDPGENVPSHKGVYSSQQDVTISGQTTKQVEVESQLETIGSRRPSKKQSSPELMIPCFQIKDADHEGWLSKLGGSGLTPKNWRRRWFVLKGSDLFYYKTAFDVSALGIVRLKGYTISETLDSKKSFAFQASKEGQRTYYFVADTNEEMNKWMALFKAAANEEVVL